MLINAINFLGLHELRPLEVAMVRLESQRWAADKTLHSAKPIDGYQARFFFNTTSNWLSFHGMLVAPVRAPRPYGNALQQFVEYLEREKGMSTTTISSHGLRTMRFLEWVSSYKAALPLVTLADVEGYLAYKRGGGFKPRSIASVCQSLRTFFRYAETSGWSSTTIAAGIQSPVVPRYDLEPKGPRWSEVKRLIARSSTPSNAALRARAMLLLFSVCGLRSSEVSNLLLSDFDWFEETFLVRRSKRGRVQRLPIAFEVGEAILAYIKAGRPTCACRHLFVTLNPPHRRVPMTSMGTIVERRMKRLEIKSPHYGPHALRHSCATQLLHKGSSLKEIADFLGHRDLSCVSIYAKSSKASIRRVAAFSLDGLA